MSEQTLSQDRGEGVKVTVSMSAQLPTTFPAPEARDRFFTARFIDAVIEEACSDASRRFHEEVTPLSLSQKGQTRPFATARRNSCFILHYHPLTRGMGSITLGRKFNRDHTTILSALNAAAADLLYRPRDMASRSLIATCNALSAEYGSFDFYQCATIRTRGR